MNWRICASITFVLCSLCLLLPGLLLYTLGYIPRQKWNNELQQTKAMVMGYEKISCRGCIQCSEDTCYHLKIVLLLLSVGNETRDWEPCEVIESESDEQNCLDQYRIHSIINIYYNMNDHNDIRLDLYHTQVYYDATWYLLTCYFIGIFLLFTHILYRDCYTTQSKQIST